MFVFTGASFGNLKEGGSQGSYLIFLDHTDYHCNLLNWQSKRQTMPHSLLAAEKIAAVKGIDSNIYIRDILWINQSSNTDNSIYT